MRLPSRMKVLEVRKRKTDNQCLRGSLTLFVILNLRPVQNRRQLYT